MKKVVFGAGLLLALVAAFAFAQPVESVTPAPVDAKINWLSWEEAMTAMDKAPKKMFIDVYTDWCGWCKRMDASTFTDPAVIKHMNENYYAVKFNAEGQADQQYKGRTLSYQSGGNRGVHQLAVVLLNGRLGYPSFVYLDEDQNSIKVSPGYKTPDVLLAEMKTISGSSN
jgi:thioredoxin-related protein